MRAIPANASWSVVNVMFLGGQPPSDAVGIGIFPSAGRIHVFTSLVLRSKMVFRDTGVPCEPRCRITLRADSAAFVASAGGRVVGSWPRFALRAPAPAVQLNAETSAPRDRIDALLTPVQVTVRAHSIAPPACAFTTRGIEVRRAPDGSLHYTGMYRDDARTAYFSLAAPDVAKEDCSGA